MEAATKILNVTTLSAFFCPILDAVASIAPVPQRLREFFDMYDIPPADAPRPHGATWLDILIALLKLDVLRRRITPSDFRASRGTGHYPAHFQERIIFPHTMIPGGSNMAQEMWNRLTMVFATAAHCGALRPPPPRLLTPRPGPPPHHAVTPRPATGMHGSWGAPGNAPRALPPLPRPMHARPLACASTPMTPGVWPRPPSMEPGSGHGPSVPMVTPLAPRGPLMFNTPAHDSTPAGFL